MASAAAVPHGEAVIVSNPDLSRRLLGRDTELATLTRLLDEVQAGASRVLVLRGEPGVGKTSLLDHVDRVSAGCHVVRVAGMESEMELAYAGLHQVCAPLVEGIDRLPPPQRDALTTAFGLRDGDPPDRFVVGLALLTLVSEASDDRPLLALIDDAQWLDRASAQALGFVARRLLAEPVGFVFATRTLDHDLDLQALPDLTIRGLGSADARLLLDREIDARLDERVRDQILAESRGNPLAILELPRGLTSAELAGGFAMPTARPLASSIEMSFQRQLRPLTPDASLLLVLASADPTGDDQLLRNAAALLGIPAEAEAEAEETDLVRFGPGVRFRHPLVRSSIYRAAGVLDRRRAHRALAEATDPKTDPDRRAWHRAQAAATPDESVARDLELSAERALQRGGVAAAAAFLERSVELTPDLTRQAERSLAAAHAKLEAGDIEAAHRLLETSGAVLQDDRSHALQLQMRGQIAFAQRRGRDAPQLFLDAARALEPVDPAASRETYLDALGAAVYAGTLSDVGLREVALAARSAPLPPGPMRPVDLLLDALAAYVLDGAEAGIPLLRTALPSFQQEGLASRDDIMRWLTRVWPLAEESAVHLLWDLHQWNDLADQAVHLARDVGALAALPDALAYVAGAKLFAGELSVAAALTEEAERIATATGVVQAAYAPLVLAAWGGDESVLIAITDEALRDSTERGEGLVVAVCGYARSVIYNAKGRYDLAQEAARRARSCSELSFAGSALVELVEASALNGSHDEALRALVDLEARTLDTGSEGGLGLLARSRALAYPEADPEPLYIEAIERLAASGIAVHQARAHLVYGEWLRQADRQTEARRQLRVAHDMFAGFGAEAFADRARRALAATGATARPSAHATGLALTAQESQIATLAAAGHTNSEIGSQLFISPKTVEYHLGKVFSRLGIRSRRELSSALATSQAH